MAKKTKKKPRPASRAQPPASTSAPHVKSAPRSTAPATSTRSVMAQAPSQPFSWLVLGKAAIITGVVLWIYSSVLHGMWLWDDDYLISQNGEVHSPDGILDIWFNPASLIDFFPMTVSLEWLEWQLWPNDPFCYHLTSVILHIISSLLIWRLFYKLGLRLAWLGGLLFAIHPGMVESVAWMAELKNTFATPWFLLAACAWVDFDRTRKIDHYFTALGLFLIAMFCKTTMVMFPFLILFYAWWRRERIALKDVYDSVPFFGISFAIGMMVVAFLRHGVGEELTPLGGIFSRMACAGLSFSFYFSKCVLPIKFFPIYPQWDVNPPTPEQFIPWPVFGVALWWLWTKRHTWGRHVLFGFGFFILNLLPFVGFRMISFMRFTWVMDHFLYLPIIGLLGLAVAAAGQLDERFSAAGRPWRYGAVAVIFGLLALESHRYAKIFNNQTALWTYTINHNPWAWPAYNNLGNVLSDEQRLPEAKLAYESALRLNPFYPEAHNNLGRIYAAWGDFPKALDQFNAALYLCPELVSAQQNQAAVLEAMAMQARNAPPSRK
jgi:protein O-mannosyl-transferase